MGVSIDWSWRRLLRLAADEVLGMMVTSIAAVLLFAQAAPVVARPVQPWSGDIQVLVCDLASDDGPGVQFVLTLMEESAFIADGRDDGISMPTFEAIRPLPGVVRDQATMRRLEFNVGGETAFVRQLYGERSLERTFISVVAGSLQQGDLPFERLVGFCQRAKQSPDLGNKPG